MFQFHLQSSSPTNLEYIVKYCVLKLLGLVIMLLVWNIFAIQWFKFAWDLGLHTFNFIGVLKYTQRRVTPFCITSTLSLLPYSSYNSVGNQIHCFVIYNSYFFFKLSRYMYFLFALLVIQKIAYYKCTYTFLINNCPRKSHISVNWDSLCVFIIHTLNFKFVHSGSIQYFSIVNNAVVNNIIHMYFHILWILSLESIPRNGLLDWKTNTNTFLFDITEFSSIQIA